MLNLKSDFINRFHSKKEEIIFSTLGGKNYSNLVCEYYFFYIYKMFEKKKNNNKVILFCNSTIESHLLSFFLILSPLKCFLISENINLDNLKKIIKDNDINNLISLQEKNYFTKLKNDINIIKILSLDEFIKYEYKSFCVDDTHNCFKENAEIGDSIFLSSGSTGEPKLIPLTFSQINSCYNNVISGFLNSIIFEKIISLHDTSFVIILPFLFSFSSNKKSIVSTSDGSLNLIPIIQLSNNLQKISKSKNLFISVPSIYRMLSKLLKEKSNIFFKRQNLITCGEPLDKKLALNILSKDPEKFFNLYGSTEVSPWIIFLDVINFIKSFSNFDLPLLPAGKSLPNVNLELSKTNELLVNSDSVFSGYLRKENKHFFTKKGGRKFFKTGDNFELINNFLYCKGRINNSIKVGGIFVNPMILEAKIKDDLNLEYILVIPDQIKLVINIILFKNKNKFKVNKSNNLKILEIIYSTIAGKIPLKFIEEKDQIRFLTSGKIDRKFYTHKYIND